MAVNYVPHTPGLAAAIAEVAPNRVDDFLNMLSEWRRIAKRVAQGESYDPQRTTLDNLRIENATVSDVGEHRPWTEIENSFLREKASFWTDKQMARELVGHSENAVRNHRYRCGIPGRRGL